MTLEQFEEVMKGINSLQELCEWVVRRDSRELEEVFDFPKWQKVVDLLEREGAGKGTDWERNRRNWERMRIDNVRGRIY